MKQADGRSIRRVLSILFIALGALLLLLVPGILVALAFAQATDVDIPGTLVIVSAVLGMMLVVVGAALRE